MALPLTLSNGLKIRIIVREEAHQRLAKTCFRGVDNILAGNFFAFEDVSSTLRNESILSGLKRSILESMSEFEEIAGRRGTRLNTFSETIRADRIVGWESTDALEKYEATDLEPFEPNRKSNALRVKRDRTDILAPKTDLVTIVYEIKHENENPLSGWVVIIHSIYPGEDIGELDGDITEREKRIFFDWNHPGEE